MLGPTSAGPLFLLSTGLAMLAWTWGAWPDPLIDFGRELYVPWRLAEGDALHADIAWFNGPLSQHWNALLFLAFGPGLSVLVWANVFVLAAAVGMVYELVSGLAGRLAAATAGAVFLFVFAFGQYVGIGNYNWITPYSHEVTHGVTLGLAAVAALDRWGRTGSRPVLALGGWFLGLSFLTKVEPFLAASAACATLLAPALARRDLRSLGAFTGASLAPVLVSAVLLGWRATLGAWPYALAGEVTRLPYYVAGMGFDAPGLRVAEVLAWSGLWLVVFAPPVAVAWLARDTRSGAVPLVAGGVALAIFAGLGDAFVWRESVRPVGLLTLVTFVALAVRRARGDRSRRNLLALALASFSMALLLKMLLNVRVSHYGFVLAMPATLVAVTVLVGWLPAWLARRGARGDVLRACAVAVVVVFAARHVEATHSWLAQRTERVGTGRDAFRADVRGAVVAAAVEHVRGSAAGSLAVLPEGVMINYLTRTPTPTRYVTFMPPEEIFFGDEAWTAAFRASPPDLVLRVPRDASEYGRPPFGVGFGRSLADWLGSQYAPGLDIGVPGVPFEIRSLVPRSEGDAALSGGR